MAFWIVTDVCCDLPATYIKKFEDFLVMPMSYQIDGELKEIDPLDEDLEKNSHVFYERLMAGKSSTTFQINQQAWMDSLKLLCEQEHDVLVLAFSSGLSGTYESAMLSVSELQLQFPQRKLYVVDTLAASLGEGLFVHHMLEYRNQGKNIDETYQYALGEVQKVNHWFTVSDLHFLRRGGRVSTTSAYLGSMLKIKPVMNVDPKGKLIPREKVQGRKRSLHTLFEKAKQYANHPENQTMFISHGDCEQDALWLADKLKTELNVPTIKLSTIGPIIGSHSGPGTVALFFMGKDGGGRLTSPEK